MSNQEPCPHSKADSSGLKYPEMISLTIHGYFSFCQAGKTMHVYILYIYIINIDIISKYIYNIYEMVSQLGSDVVFEMQLDSLIVRHLRKRKPPNKPVG